MAKRMESKPRDPERFARGPYPTLLQAGREIRPWPACRVMEGLDSSREERDGGVPRGPGGPPHQINAGPRVRENYVALTVRERSRSFETFDQPILARCLNDCRLKAA